MPAIDSCQPEVVNALQNDGWRVIIPAQFGTPDFSVQIDLMAQKEDMNRYIEVKCFPRANLRQELYVALGQYILYREVLAHEKPDTTVWLAIPLSIYQEVFTPTIREALKHNHVKLIVVNISAERIVQWIDW